MTPTAPATTSAQALQNLQSFQGSEQSPQALLQGQEQSLGVPQAQQQVSGLRSAIQNTTNLLNQVAPSVYGNTQNSLVTDAQANQQIQNRQAPLNSQLNTEGTDYTNAESDANNALSQASTLAQLEEQGQTGQESYLQGIYSDLSGQEQQAAANSLAQQQLAEQAREANLSAGSSGVGSPSLASLGLSGVGSASATATQRSGGGYNFVNASGQPISAAQYSAIKGIPFRTLLSEMASAGDSGAKTALTFVGNDYGYDPTKITSSSLANLYNSLVGGTGKTATYLPAGLTADNGGPGLTY